MFVCVSRRDSLSGAEKNKGHPSRAALILLQLLLVIILSKDPLEASDLLICWCPLSWDPPARNAFCRLAGDWFPPAINSLTEIYLRYSGLDDLIVHIEVWSVKLTNLRHHDGLTCHLFEATKVRREVEQTPSEAIVTP